MSIEDAVVGVAKREPVDVAVALRKVKGIRRDRDLGPALVRLGLDADSSTIEPLLQAVSRLKSDKWRARTLFSTLLRVPTRLLRTLPPGAQRQIETIVEGIRDEDARAAALLNLPREFPDPLTERLAGLGEQLVSLPHRLEVAVRYADCPGVLRPEAMVSLASEIQDETQRAKALMTIAPALGERELEDAFAVARQIDDPGTAAPALVKLAERFSHVSGRRRAHSEILRLASRISDPVRKFDVPSISDISFLRAEATPRVSSLCLRPSARAVGEAPRGVDPARPSSARAARHRRDGLVRPLPWDVRDH